MIRIKAVEAQNILDVCRLTTNQDGVFLMVFTSPGRLIKRNAAMN